MTSTSRHILVSATGIAALVAPLLATGSAAAAEPLPCTAERPYRDLDGDGFEDVAIGDPYATVAGQPEAGTVTVIFGESSGRIGDGERTRVITQSDLGETPEAGDHFGWALDMNRTSSGGCTGLIIGSPGEDVGAGDDAGMVHVFTINAADSGAQSDRATNLDQSTLGGTVEDDDELGYSVAAVGGRDENPVRFAFGAPGENAGGGVVNWADETTLGVSGQQDRLGARGLPGSPREDARFGETVAFFNYYAQTDDDDPYIYAGAPGDFVGSKAAAGSVTVFGEFSRPRSGDQPAIPFRLTQDTSGVPGGAEAGDRFGSSMAVSAQPPSPDPRQLAIGSPGEDVGSVKDAGSVTVLKKRRQTGNDLPAIVLTQSTKGVAGSVEKGDLFGSAVGYRDDRTLAIGTPGEDVGSVVDAGTVHVIRIGTSALSFPYPTITEDYPGTPGTITRSSRFGSVVHGLPSSDVVQSSPPSGGYGEAIIAIPSLFQDGGSVFALSSTGQDFSWLPASGQTGVRFGQSVD